MKDDFQIFDLDELDFEDQIIADTEEAILEQETEYEGEYSEEYTDEENIEYADEAEYEDENIEYADDTEYEEEYEDENVEYADEAEYEDENIEYADDTEYEEEYEDENIEYADDAEYEDENIEYADDAEYEDDEIEYADDAEYEDEYEDNLMYEDDLSYENLEEEEKEHALRPKRPKGGFIGKVKQLFSGGHGMDMIVAATGVLVVVIGIITAVAWNNSASIEEQVEAMASVGESLGNVSVVGESALLAVKDAYVAMINSVPTEEESNEENIDVKVNFTSIEKDLKIKFLNKETGALVTGVGFKVELTDAKKNTTTLSDDNKDGIIYETKMKPGSYDVVCLNVGGFSFPQSGTSIKVKDKVDYQKIDIADEVKKESQVNVAAEDTQKVEKGEEVKLTDTVEWVESTKTPINADSNFTQIEKGKIPDPSTLGRAAGSFQMMAAPTVSVSLSKTSITDAEIGATGTLTATPNATEGYVTGTTSWSSGNESVVTVDASSGAYKVVGSGSAAITASVTATKPTTVTDPSLPDSVTGSASCSFTVAETVKDEVTAISLTAAPNSVTQGGTTTFTATVTTTGNASKKANWTVEGPATLSAATAESGAAITVTVKADAAVDATVKVTATADGKSSMSASESFKVTAAPITTYITKVSVIPDKFDLPAGTAKRIEAKVEKAGTGTIDQGVTWKLANDAEKEYLTLAADGTVTALPAGIGKTVAVIATTKGNGSDGKTPLKAESKVTITKGTAVITLDKTTLSLPQGKEDVIKATVSNLANTTVTWKTDNDKIATVDANGKVKGIALGTVNITATTAGKEVSAICKITVVKSAQGDKTTKLKDKDGNQIYVKEDGKFREAVYADYYTASEFFVKGQEQYRYTGWQTLDNKTYYFNKNGDKITGEQVIQGVKYNFASDGVLSMGNGAMGIDVSRYNGNINWQAVKNSGVSYAIIRCGYRGYSSGVLVEDSKFRANIQGATAAGIKVGVYFVTQAVNEVEAVQEASMVLDMIKPYRVSYPVFIDIERSGGRGDGIDRGTRTAVANAFCQTIKNNGYSAGIYANKDWFDNKMNAGQLSAHKIWLAQYSTKPTYKGRYDMWQYTSKGTIGGISGHVDLNTSYLGY